MKKNKIKLKTMILKKSRRVNLLKLQQDSGHRAETVWPNLQEVTIMILSRILRGMVFILQLKR
jgi:hypothetical protein